MAFDSFSLEPVVPVNRRRIQDIDLLTFAVLVSGREHGHGAALIRAEPSDATERAITAAEINQAADRAECHSEAHEQLSWRTAPP